MNFSLDQRCEKRDRPSRAEDPSPSALLIISAIDLLLASLVCGVVLFVALVGAHGPSSDEQTGDAPQAPIPITLLYRLEPPPSNGESPKIHITNAERVGEPQDASAESLEHSGFKIDAIVERVRRWSGPFSSGVTRRQEKYQWASFHVSPGKKAISIENIPNVAYAAIHLGKGGSYYIWMRCVDAGWKLDLALDPVIVLDDTCPARSDHKELRPNEAPPKPFLIVSNQAPPAPDWIFMSRLLSGTGTVSQWNGPSTEVPLDVSTAIFTY